MSSGFSWIRILLLILLVLFLLWILRQCGVISPQPQAQGKIVFVSSQLFDGNFVPGLGNDYRPPCVHPTLAQVMWEYDLYAYRAAIGCLPVSTRDLVERSDAICRGRRHGAHSGQSEPQERGGCQPRDAPAWGTKDH